MNVITSNTLADFSGRTKSLTVALGFILASLTEQGIIYANLTAYINAITPLIARGAAECKLMQ